MRIPNDLPARPQQQHKDGAQRQSATRSHAGSSGLSQAGCCAEVCVAGICQCVAHSPFC